MIICYIIRKVVYFPDKNHKCHNHCETWENSSNNKEWRKDCCVPSGFNTYSKISRNNWMNRYNQNSSYTPEDETQGFKPNPLTTWTSPSHTKESVNSFFNFRCGLVTYCTKVGKHSKVPEWSWYEKVGSNCREIPKKWRVEIHP